MWIWLGIVLQWLPGIPKAAAVTADTTAEQQRRNRSKELWIWVIMAFVPGLIFGFSLAP